jgi:hypothetical protein
MELTLTVRGMSSVGRHKLYKFFVTEDWRSRTAEFQNIPLIPYDSSQAYHTMYQYTLTNLIKMILISKGD